MIELVGVSKRFASKQVVFDMSFHVNRGDILGLLGPNGAGKSTTMKMITGYLKATSGTISVCGFNLNSQTLDAQSVMGYVPENAPLYEDMLVIEFLNYMADLRNLLGNQKVSRVEYIVQTCSLKSVLYQKIETLSKGFKRRVSLAQALLHDPKVLILDEPTDGLDPNQKYDMRKVILELAKEKSILVSTHILEEVQAICSRCIIINEGKKLFDGTPDELKQKSSDGRLDSIFRQLTLKNN